MSEEIDIKIVAAKSFLNSKGAADWPENADAHIESLVKALKGSQSDKAALEAENAKLKERLSMGGMIINWLRNHQCGEGYANSTARKVHDDYLKEIGCVPLELLTGSEEVADEKAVRLLNNTDSRDEYLGNYHVGFFDKVRVNERPQLSNSGQIVEGYNLCQSKDGKHVGFIYNKELVHAIVNKLNGEQKQHRELEKRLKRALKGAEFNEDDTSCTLPGEIYFDIDHAVLLRDCLAFIRGEKNE